MCMINALNSAKAGMASSVTIQNKALFGDELIDLCLFQNGFGKMVKNDYEVVIFHLLMKYSNLNNMSPFVISTILKIPESKVKRLIYESELIYGDFQESNMIENLKLVLQKAQFREKENKISFAVRDKMLRNYISSFLTDNGHFNDGSFNSDIVVMHVDTFIFLLDKLCYTEKEKEEIEKKCQTKFSGNKKRTFSDLWKTFIDSAIKESGKVTVDRIISHLFDLPKLIKILSELNF